MKLSLALAVLAGLAGSVPTAARAAVACNNNAGMAPRAGSELPAHPRIVYYDDRDSYTPTFTAKIDGVAVPIKVSTLVANPYDITVLEIDSSKTGKLVLYTGDGTREYEFATYKIGKSAKLPKDITATAARFGKTVRHTSVREKFDGLAVVLPDATPAITAHVKLRRDDKSDWLELDAPVAAGDWIDKRTAVRLGQLGCTSNYSVPLLEAGVDIEVTLTLVDGSTRTVTLPKHVKI
jgi:hypothetical protein